MSSEEQATTPIEKMWRHGRLLICHRDAPFPDRCVLSNDPVGMQRKKIRLKWQHPLMFLAGHSRVRSSQVTTVVLAVGLCPACQRRVRLVQRVAAVVIFISLAAIVAGLAALTPYSTELAIGGFAGLLFGFIFDRLFGRTLTAKEIDTRYVRARGASAAFLAELPEWPGGKKP
jgi:hypothetical protein